MRHKLVVSAIGIAVLAGERPVSADSMPPGALGVTAGIASGTGADANRLGYGFHQFGLHAAWQPTSSDRRVGPSIRWGTMFGMFYGGSAAQLDSALHTVTMDLAAGLRIRPWRNISRYLALRAGVTVLRSDQPIPPTENREFVGGIATLGFEQYLGSFLLDVSVRYSFANDTPKSLALLVGFALTGP